MPKIWSLVKIATLEVIMFSSVALTARAVEPPMNNSPSLANSPLLISQSYGGGSSFSYEEEGDNFFYRGQNAYENGQYEQAYYYFNNAAESYARCYREMKRIGDSRTEKVTQKYRQAQDWIDYLS